MKVATGVAVFTGEEMARLLPLVISVMQLEEEAGQGAGPSKSDLET